MKSLWKLMIVGLVGAALALGITGCGKPNAEMTAPVADQPHPDIARAAPRTTQPHPDIR